MTRNSNHHQAALHDVRTYLSQFDSVAGGSIPIEQHISAMNGHIQAVRTSLSDGLDRPPERFRLARIAAHAIALMSDGTD
jgi:hypothetical protein